jgi:hypothetical protein
MTNVNQISVYKPKGWNFNELVHSNRPTHQKRKVERITHFASSILTKNLYQKKAFNTPVNLHAEVLGGLYGKDYKNQIIDPLVKANYLKVNDKFSAGNFSKSYALNLEGFTQLEEVLLVDPTFVKKVNETARRRTDFILKTYPESQAIYHTILQTSVDYEPCLQHLNKKFNVNFFKELYSHLLGRYGRENTKELLRLCIKANSYTGKFKLTLKNQIKNRYGLKPYDLENLLKYTSSFTTYKSYIWHLKNWKRLSEADIDHKKNFIFFTTDKSKRLYHNASSTPKDIRKFLRVQGEPLVEIDASNSQWFLLVALLEAKAVETREHILYSHNKNRSSKVEGGRTTTNHNHTKTLPLMFPTFSSELQTLKAYLEQGVFRQVFTAVISEMQGHEYTEGKTKGLLIKRILFEDPNRNYMVKEPIVQAFKSLFPTLYKSIVWLKKEGLDYHSLGYSQSDSYKALAVELQRMESSIFVRGVHKHLEGVLRLSIHDALLVRQNDVKRVLNALKTTAKDKWGINLKVTLSKLEKE